MKYSFAQAIVPKINAFKQYYVCKEELVALYHDLRTLPPLKVGSNSSLLLPSGREAPVKRTPLKMEEWRE